MFSGKMTGISHMNHSIRNEPRLIPPAGWWGIKGGGGCLAWLRPGSVPVRSIEHDAAHGPAVGLAWCSWPCSPAHADLALGLGVVAG